MAARVGFRGGWRVTWEFIASFFINSVTILINFRQVFDFFFQNVSFYCILHGRVGICRFAVKLLIPIIL